MKTYRLNTEESKAEPIRWDEGERHGFIEAQELGTHHIEGEEIRGTHVPGPFRVAGEDDPCESGLLLIDDHGLRSYYIEEPDPNLVVEGPLNDGWPDYEVAD